MKPLAGPAVRLLLGLTLLLGVLYPGLITVVGKSFFPRQAGGSLLYRGDVLVGSALLGQSFAAPGYFHGRPSATAPKPYDGAASVASNFGPTNPALAAAFAARARALEPDAAGAPLPADLLTASASGLDPDISPPAAALQAARIARARGWPPAQVTALIAAHVRPPTFGFLGEPRVNVLELNLALDAHERGAARP